MKNRFVEKDDPLAQAVELAQLIARSEGITTCEVRRYCAPGCASPHILHLLLRWADVPEEMSQPFHYTSGE